MSSKLHLLGRVRGVNNHRMLGGFVCYQIGIVIALPGPWGGLEELIQHIRVYLCMRGCREEGHSHMGIEWTCMVLNW